MSEVILNVEDLHYKYGEIEALKGINLKVHKGEIVTLVGGNGAGKTTTLRSISKLLGNIKGGSISFMGQSINRLKPHKVASLGLCQALEGRHIFPFLTVQENLMLGAYLINRKDANDYIQYVYKLFPRLLERNSQLGGTLSGGEQQMLAIGRVMMSRPKLLMLDEPSLGLAPIIVREIFEIIKKINEDGMPILLVEQNSNAALKIAHRGYVIETGKIVLEDKAENLINNEEVKKSYLGE